MSITITNNQFVDALKVFCKLNYSSAYNLAWDVNEYSIMIGSPTSTRGSGAVIKIAEYTKSSGNAFIEKIYDSGESYINNILDIPATERLRIVLREMNYPFEEVYMTIQRYIVEAI